MTLRWKNILYTLGLFSAMFLVWHYRQDKTAELIWFQGKTMGPITYNVKYADPKKRNFKKEVDSLLVVFNQSLNTYIPTSEISKFNTSDEFQFKLPFFYEALSVSKDIYEKTEGAFDPSIGPYINAWGFGPEDGFIPDSVYIDSLSQFVGYEKVSFTNDIVTKSDSRVNISFSASAKGYGVDVVAEYLESKNIENYFVEIGGEVRVKGKNVASNKSWSVGILHPDSDELQQKFFAIVQLKDQALATSGNYFNYHIVEGVKYGHTIDPKTGYPIEHKLLSASVFAPTCHEADALATAFMVMGKETTIQFLENHKEYDAYLLFSNDDGSISAFATAGIENSIEKTQ
ncbi:FAD:protein FMN transferase [Fulvivirga lutea]|uniref:FAD:protein FMN transferase n=1 Tax=Fulvivirga lutea TaxID=2810512 RepID=A0A975A246_9BACT|nr:FAD:protein FMN transferase [Fulvivirga lutea]QSE98486.1 FAD:protein FMN transferase [Fulvivirga lutea]